MNNPIHIVSQEIALVKESYNPLSQITSESLYAGNNIAQALVRSYDMVKHYRDVMGGLSPYQTRIEMVLYGKKAFTVSKIVEIGSIELCGILQSMNNTILILADSTSPGRFNFELSLTDSNAQIPFEHRQLVLNHNPVLWNGVEVIKYNATVVRSLELRLVNRI